jgi:hypothetical protein
MISFSKKLAMLLSTTPLLTVLGCAGVSVNPVTIVTTTPVTTTTMIVAQGHVYSGTLAVSGATIKLYAVGTTGYGAASTSLLQTSVTTASDGGFTIYGDYICPANALVYVVAVGGNPGITGTQTNSALAMMAGLGACSGLTSSTAIQINELTTVASVWALSGFMNSSTAVGTSATNVQGLTNAFAAINKIVHVSTGTLPGTALPTGASLPTTNINTLANILAACVNTVNQASGSISANCGTLFANTTVGGSVPADTIQAALNMAQHPSLNLATLNALANAAGATYAPSLGTSTPTSWQIAINYVGGGLSSPTALAIDTSGNVWIANGGNNSVTELSNSGATLSGSTGFTAGGINAPTAITLDSSNTAWVANSGNNTLTHLSADGASGVSITGGGLNKPTSLAIDQNGDVWVSNAGNSSLSEFTATGVALSGANGFMGGGLNQPVAIAIEP